MKTILTLAAIIFLTTLVFAQDETSTNPPPGFATRADYLKSLTSEKKMLEAYHAGLISKDEAGQLLENFGDKSSMDTYGKVVDQDGNPVAGALVRAGLETEFGDPKEHDTKTDDQGRFQLLGLRGTGLDIDPEKEGYYFDFKLPCSTRPEVYVPDPNNPLIITMWKLRGAEPMIHSELDSRIPYDGTTAAFDLTTLQKSTNGNLKITLLRSPLKIRRGRQKFDWDVKIEITNGVLQADSSPYPYWAHESGYQSTFVTSMRSNNIAWKRELKQDFYIKDGKGKYGRLLIDLSTDSVRPDTGIGIETWFNPSGSQNLEVDPSKQINQR